MEVSLVAQAEGNEWKRDLLFEVPRAHPEMQRLQGRYQKCARPMHHYRAAHWLITVSEDLRSRTVQERTAVSFVA